MLPAASSLIPVGMDDDQRTGRYRLGIPASGWGYVYAAMPVAEIAIVRDVKIVSRP